MRHIYGQLVGIFLMGCGNGVPDEVEVPSAPPVPMVEPVTAPDVVPVPATPAPDSGTSETIRVIRIGMEAVAGQFAGCDDALPDAPVSVVAQLVVQPDGTVTDLELTAPEEAEVGPLLSCLESILVGYDFGDIAEATPVRKTFQFEPR